MSTLRTILSDNGRRLFILTSIMMLMVTSYRPIMLHEEAPSRMVSHYHDASAEDEHSSDHISIVSAVHEAIVPIYKVQVAVVYNEIFTLELIEEIKECIHVFYPLPQSSYFRILFRTFISPNAP
ncbi:hypothetical protein PZB74_11810 [Porifericola rhodea]|uniref:hypothetical protein n=1 Tax=Porifericola rhodea TaxID=930972 RepID=UPI002664FA02|nr:hypothetical protein [Porifericola rhodea]WKN29651.1 hypothetical protein PZB74_11810 [Porifericola rhodea]